MMFLPYLVLHYLISQSIECALVWFSEYHWPKKMVPFAKRLRSHFTVKDIFSMFLFLPPPFGSLWNNEHHSERVLNGLESPCKSQRHGAGFFFSDSDKGVWGSLKYPTSPISSICLVPPSEVGALGMKDGLPFWTASITLETPFDHIPFIIIFVHFLPLLVFFHQLFSGFRTKKYKTTSSVSSKNIFFWHFGAFEKRWLFLIHFLKKLHPFLWFFLQRFFWLFPFSLPSQLSLFGDCDQTD